MNVTNLLFSSIVHHASSSVCGGLWAESKMCQFIFSSLLHANVCLKALNPRTAYIKQLSAFQPWAVNLGSSLLPSSRALPHTHTHTHTICGQDGHITSLASRESKQDVCWCISGQMRKTYLKWWHELRCNPKIKVLKVLEVKVFAPLLQIVTARSPAAQVMCLKTVLRKFSSPGVASWTDGEATSITRVHGKKKITWESFIL